ncbi:HAD family hydrolase [Amaricoccus solimangrovi]|uniref:HAD-IA family hydrolase n=1 Tax=Amaricoccus solimangrovi TaxID=2589815 RepID=A0A501WFJ6_9RHOB|nr:HAD-IA family hydrolase [Amaricoccus solimangrovi]TPE48329.1 HAD-IA family hydrolase [Amaricoccus solimangrovi]
MSGGPLVIFDCDGVLVDSEPLAMAVLLEAIRAQGLEIDPGQGYELFLGRSLASIGQMLVEDFGVALDALALDEMRQRLYAKFRAELTPIPHVPEVVSRLANPFCVASSSQPERVELALRLTGLWDHFEGKLFSATMVAHGKPAPDLFLLAAGRMGYAPGNSLVVEDSAAGIRAAQAAHMRVAAFTGGGHARNKQHEARLRVLEPDWIIDDMRDLPTLLRRWP